LRPWASKHSVPAGSQPTARLDHHTERSLSLSVVNKNWVTWWAALAQRQPSSVTDFCTRNTRLKMDVFTWIKKDLKSDLFVANQVRGAWIVQATGWTNQESWFDSQQGYNFFFLKSQIRSRSQPGSCSGVTRFLSSGLKWPGHETD
jgi:hypothetical protein